MAFDCDGAGQRQRSGFFAAVDEFFSCGGEPHAHGVFVFGMDILRIAAVGRYDHGRMGDRAGRVEL